MRGETGVVQLKLFLLQHIHDISQAVQWVELSCSLVLCAVLLSV